MTYCSVSDVRAIVNTNLTDEQITTIIETSDAYIDKLLGAQPASDKLIKKLSMLITAKTVRTRDPQSQSLGEYSEFSGNVIAAWDAKIRDITSLYRRSLKRA